VAEYTNKEHMKRMRKEFGTYTLTGGGTVAITTGLRPIETLSICARNGGTVQHRVSSSNLSAGSFKVTGTSTEIGVWHAEGL
jgi:hypothetical protein